MADIAHSQRLLRVRLVCRGCKFRPFSHANSPRLSLVCVYAWRFWPIVSAFVFSQRQLSLSASMHNTPGSYDWLRFGQGETDRQCLLRSQVAVAYCDWSLAIGRTRGRAITNDWIRSIVGNCATSGSDH